MDRLKVNVMKQEKKKCSIYFQYKEQDKYEQTFTFDYKHQGQSQTQYICNFKPKSNDIIKKTIQQMQNEGLIQECVQKLLDQQTINPKTQKEDQKTNDILNKIIKDYDTNNVILSNYDDQYNIYYMPLYFSKKNDQLQYTVCIEQLEQQNKKIDDEQALKNYLQNYLYDYEQPLYDSFQQNQQYENKIYNLIDVQVPIEKHPPTRPKENEQSNLNGKPQFEITIPIKFCLYVGEQDGNSCLKLKLSMDCFDYQNEVFRFCQLQQQNKNQQIKNKKGFKKIDLQQNIVLVNDMKHKIQDNNFNVLEQLNDEENEENEENEQ